MHSTAVNIIFATFFREVILKLLLLMISVFLTRKIVLVPFNWGLTAFELAKTVHALSRAATVTGF
jgi:hypothetical protein